MRRSGRWGTMRRSFWNTLCSFLSLQHEKMCKQKSRLITDDTRSVVSDSSTTPPPHPCELCRWSAMLGRYTLHGLLCRSVVRNELGDHRHGWAAALEHGKKERQLTHGFFLCPSLRALAPASFSGGEFSSGIGNTTGKAPKGMGSSATCCTTL
jgi:hypothetical protein